MDNGPLRYRVAVQQLVAGSPQQTPTGEPDKTWTTLATVWGDIRPLRGQALFTAQQVNSRVSVEIDIRYSATVAAVSAGMRVLHGTTVYDIEAVPPLRPRAGKPITLQCSTGLNDG